MGLSSSNQNTPGQINTLTSHTHTLKHTILFVFSRISAPTHHCGLAQLGGKKWPIAMATVCAVLLQLWCMWWHFWPSGELCNAGAVQSPDRPWQPCLSCHYSSTYRRTVSIIWPGHHDNRLFCAYPSKQDQDCIPVSWKLNEISTVFSSSNLLWQHEYLVLQGLCVLWRLVGFCRLNLNHLKL